MIFAIPRDGKAYVGTTDTIYDNDKSSPKVTEEDRQYLIDAIHYMFPTVKVEDKDIESTWAGVRPLIFEKGKDPSEISRKDEIWEGDSGLLTIAGGKLTGYRHMAQDIVDLLSKRLKEDYKLTFKPCNTKETYISGGNVGGSKNYESFVESKVKEAKNYNLSEDAARYLARKYGSNVDEVFEIAHATQVADVNLPIEVYAEVIYSIQKEMVHKPTDFLVRRSGRLYFDISYVLEHKDAIVEVMAKVLNYDNDSKRLYKDELEQAIKEAVNPNDQPAIIK